jgi:hypothetical protein
MVMLQPLTPPQVLDITFLHNRLAARLYPERVPARPHTLVQENLLHDSHVVSLD